MTLKLQVVAQLKESTVPGTGMGDIKFLQSILTNFWSHWSAILIHLLPFKAYSNSGGSGNLVENDNIYVDEEVQPVIL